MEAISANQSSVLNQVKGTSLDEIRIVQEFLYVFLEELPGMQPHRDIEFIIELLPGTPPISSPFLTHTVVSTCRIWSPRIAVL
jgi:hypothetical protein